MESGNIAKLSVNLESCYGINKLLKNFDFSKKNTIIIYAGNGVMKTSFANTFKRISEGKPPQEKIHGKNATCELLFDDEKIQQEEIFVIEPFNESFESKRMSSLLVDKKKKEEYDKLYLNILDLKSKLFTKINRLSKIKKSQIESHFKRDFLNPDFFNILLELEDQIDYIEDFSHIQYNTIFDPKVDELLNNQEVIKNIGKYVEKYNELLDTSPYYKKGVFNPVKSENITKAIKKENFFDADHSILLNGNPSPIRKIEKLNNLFKEAQEQILNDPKLIHIKDIIVQSVNSVKDFQDVIEKYPEVTLELHNKEEFRKKLLKSYLLKEKDLYIELNLLYKRSKEEMEKIEKEAKIEKTYWYQAKKIFHDRFFVPFKVDIRDKKNVILGTNTPNIIFRFKDEDSGKYRDFSREELQSLKILSQGEKRALYLLYIIFEVEARKRANQKTIFIIDDIADSFDYKNKYAIIEYLKEISDNEDFYQIILTHNFDFYRTVQSRILMDEKWTNSFIAQREDNEIILLNGGNKNIVSPFNIWKSQLSSNKAMLISSIPFVRNLIEFKDGKSNDSYKLLTSMLHIKKNPDSYSITLTELNKIFQECLKDADILSENKDEKVISLVLNEADNISKLPLSDDIALENKIALAIAIRLKAEEYMWKEISDKSEIRKNQTGLLFDRFKNEFKSDLLRRDTIKLLEQVNLMTPENIHINSFMYEPIIDMSYQHLCSLYENIKTQLI